MEWKLAPDDLSDEGLDLLLRLMLKTQTPQIHRWDTMGALLEEHRISLMYVADDHWTADFEPEGESISEHGKSPRQAIAVAMIRWRFPEGIAFRLPASKLDELVSEDYKASVFYQNNRQLMQIGSSLDAIEGVEQDGKVVVCIDHVS